MDILLKDKKKIILVNCGTVGLQMIENNIA